MLTKYIKRYTILYIFYVYFLYIHFFKKTHARKKGGFGQMKKIAFSLQKGGVGKSSLSVSLAAELAEFGRTVVVDCDPQGSSTSWILPPDTELTGELADFLNGAAPLSQTVFPTSQKNLDIVPTAGLENALKVFTETQAAVKIKCFAKLFRELEAMGYEYAVLDTSPAFGIFEKNALSECDAVVAPVMADYFGVDGIQIFSQKLRELHDDRDTEKPEFAAVIENMIDRRLSENMKYEKELDGCLKGAVDVYKVPTDQVFKKAQSHHRTIQSEGGAKKETLEAFRKLADALR